MWERQDERCIEGMIARVLETVGGYRGAKLKQRSEGQQKALMYQLHLHAQRI
jgi:hypothetical protein